MSTQKRRILIIDDQAAIHDDYRKIIQPRSPHAAALDEAEAELFGTVAQTSKYWDFYQVDSAYQGEDALEMVDRSLEEGRPYSVAFVDIRMPPGLDGVRTVRSIWERDPEVLVVLCSAYSDYSWEDIVSQLGRTDRFLILKKPFDNVEVRQFAAALTERWVLARTDVLTGLLNRRAFHEHLHREWVRSVQHRCPLACVMLDIDYFKRINDTLGHLAGDHVITTVAQIVKQHGRAQDYICRYGGEELCILLSNTTESEAYAWAVQVRLTLAGAGLTWKDKSCAVTVSLGVAERQEDTFDHEELIDRADQSLRMAKQAGRNRSLRWSKINGTELRTDLPSMRQLFYDVLARDLMTSPITSLSADMSAGEAVDFFLQTRITSAPVVDPEGRLVGIVSEKDVLELLTAADSWSPPISEVMNSNVIYYEQNTPAQAIFEFLCRVTIRRVIIVDNERPIGVISRGSFLRWGRNLARLGLGSAAPDARQQINRTAEALLKRATLLAEQLADGSADIVAPVVGETSKMQDLINDLLAWTHYVPSQSLEDCVLSCADRT